MKFSLKNALAIASFVFVCTVVTRGMAGDRIDFATQVVPIIQEHCIRCHSENLEKGDISLATIDDLLDNDFLVLEDPDGSHLIDLVTPTDDGPPAMPKESQPLAVNEIAILRAWITQGANWPADVVIKEKSKANGNWWSLQPIKQPDATATIDQFLTDKLAEHGLAMNPPADRRTLIRRATYDLTGLPPTPEEIEAFVNDTDPDAYEKLIERLLASHHYGERWGRHWLDVVRFGESIGYERNVIVNNAWPFRDYVIQSINDDKPFDQFIREHIAGDVIDNNNPDVAVGSVFLVAGPYDDVGNQDAAAAAQIRANTLDEIIRATSDAFLGMTIGCSRCHDHKFDPITQRDYYSLYATFSAVRHGSAPLASKKTIADRNAKLAPLNARKAELQKRREELRAAILTRAKKRLPEYEQQWMRPAVDRTGTEDSFPTVTTKFVRLVCESQDSAANRATGFGIDEFEIWSTEPEPRNVALSANGGKASGAARKIEDFPGAYGPQLAIDGKSGARFIAAGNDLTIELAEATPINRVIFSLAKGPDSAKTGHFVFVAEYRIEVSDDGQTWIEIANGHDRKPVNRGQHLDRRLLLRETTEEDREHQVDLDKQIATVRREIASVPPLPSVWIGSRNADDARGPFHIFLGGSPQKKGSEVVPTSLSILSNDATYKLASDAPESDRRLAFANWLVHQDNPLTARVLANRLWHYHFGTGIVDTPSDFGYMGGKPSHPELLDFLASRLQSGGWRIKQMHRMIMTSDAYQQSSQPRDEASRVDGDSRLLWRFPPRRLSAEEIRDTILHVCGKLKTDHDGGPGFRLYHFMQDNVCTYVPLDQHGPETYRRAVYHQNARASVVDLMTEFDQPDCTFSAPKRAETTTPLQALTMLNHSFTLDMADALEKRLIKDIPNDTPGQVRRAFQLSYGRIPSASESMSCTKFIDENGLAAFCRVLLNTSELIYVR